MKVIWVCNLGYINHRTLKNKLLYKLIIQLAGVYIGLFL